MSVYAIYFSPTRSTEKIVKLLAKEFGSYGEIDLSKQNSGENVRAFKEDDICVFGVPSYGGRVPAPALERMKKMKGNHAKAVLVAVYGNRAYDDTLLELKEQTEACGFTVVGAVAAWQSILLCMSMLPEDRIKRIGKSFSNLHGK